MTTFDLINVYQFNYISTKYLSGLPSDCCSMVEEMNEIWEMYRVKGVSIDKVLEQCVCRRHGHQYCIPQNAVDEAKIALKGSKFVSASKEVPFIKPNDKFNECFADFEQFYDFVASVIGNITGIGPLTVYDTAKRIGHLFDVPIYPCQYVYLNAGASDGAKALLRRNNLKFREPIKDFEPHFGTFPSIFIEDILCIFKDSFSTLPSVKLKDLLKKGNCVFKVEATPTII